MRNGFSLIEALVALAILGILLAFVIPSFAGFLQSNSNNEIRNQAIVVAQQQMDFWRQQAKGVTGSTLPTSGNSGTQSIAQGGRTFNVTTRFCPDPAQCSSDKRQFRVEVRMGTRLVYSLEAVYVIFN
ncbi:type II secretion system protein [uncultured Meiothermus sp.]|jgi:general secretion pathway protein I|uniref:type II secretion system protein n=1 Tax=uncultured Meiothermus sp. TaxID=157471 RepID=UPI00261A2F0F|nr:type II secretion system protein [uncultured Meiothermus sp.]